MKYNAFVQRIAASLSAKPLVILCRSWIGTLAIVGALGCQQTDHDLLAAKDAGSRSDARAEASIADASATDVADAAAKEDAHVDVRSSYDDDGAWAMTVVNGVVNAPYLRVCFDVSSDPQQGFAPTNATPVPDDAQGLAFAKRLTLAKLPAVDVHQHYVQPVVFTGAMDALKSKRCDQLVSLPAGVQRFAMAAMDKQVLTRGRSLLLAFAGCVPDERLKPMDPVDGGADAHRPEDAKADALSIDTLCGPGSDYHTGNLTMILTTMDRTVHLGAIGLQVMSLSLGSERLTIEHHSASPAKSETIALRLVPGTLLPRPPSGVLSVAKLGKEPTKNMLRSFIDSDATASVNIALVDALKAGGLSLDSLTDNSNYTVLVLGMRPLVQFADLGSHTAMVIPSDPN